MLHPPTGKFSAQNLSAFTLIEMLAVTAILLVLAAMTYPQIQKAMETGNRGKCIVNMKQVLAASGMYLADNSGRYWDGRREDGAVVPSQLNVQDFEKLSGYAGDKSIFSCPSYRKASGYAELPVSHPSAGYIMGYALAVGFPDSPFHPWWTESAKNTFSGTRQPVVADINCIMSGIYILSHTPDGGKRVTKDISFAGMVEKYPTATGHVGYSDGSIVTKKLSEMTSHVATGSEYFW